VGKAKPTAARSVWVLRHAKAEAHGPDDRSRALSDRGRRQASDVGRYLAGAPLGDAAVPRTVLCSSATRARQTAELAVAPLGADVEIVVEPALYGADPDDVVDLMRTLGDDTGSVLVVGHNPMLHELAVLLVDDAALEDRARVEARFPTAALAVVGVPAATWGRLALGTGRLLDLHFSDT
jgi:phosphohistidine phosphatase